MRYTKHLDGLLRKRIALQHELDEHTSVYRQHRRRAGDARAELALIDAAIATHVEEQA